jgi:D-arabinose 1-dehydrogenase-like Zn-dependent alcohol dehydrogenase
MLCRSGDDENQLPPNKEPESDMKSMVFQKPRTSLAAENRTRPNARAGEVVIRVRACGVCHGDLMVQEGAFPFVTYPVVPGHEIAGVVEELGDGVDWLSAGARVGLSALGNACGHCAACLSADEFLCDRLGFTGVTSDGGYQEFMVANAAFVVPLPENLDFVEAGPLMCAGLTVFSALRHAGFEPGDRVAVVGLGGLGEMGVLYARAMGGRVAVVSSTRDKKVDAHDLGAEHFIHAEGADWAATLAQWEGGADIILSTASSVASANAAFPGLARNGTLMLLGAGPGDVTVNPMALVMGRRRIMGSPAGSRNDLRDALGFAAKNSVHPRVTRYALEQASEALSAMHDRTLRGRAVLVMN